MDELSITQSAVCVTLILSLLRLAALRGSTRSDEFTAEVFFFFIFYGFMDYSTAYSQRNTAGWPPAVTRGRTV